jgi:AraC-like DNA-binding protein
MPDITNELYQHKPHFWNQATDNMLFDTCGIRVSFAGISYSVTPYESLYGDANNYGLSYVSEGSARIVIDNETFVVSRGDVVLFPKNTMNAIYPDADCNWEWCWIVMGGAPIDSIVEESGWLNHPCPVITNTSIPFLSITKLMMQSFHLKPNGSLIVGGLLLQLLGHITQSNVNSEIIIPQSDRDQQVTDIISYMGRHLTAQLTLEGLAEQFFLSPSQLGKLFRRVTGVSPIQYFKYLRIETAKGLLRSSMSISSIAVQVGFDEIVTFDRAFKRITGMTPRQYRQEICR